MAQPKFTALATMAILDVRTGELLHQTSVLGEPTFDMSWTQTQIEAVKSKNISLKVIRAVKLTQYPDFMGTAA
jgi:uncharacterized protein involved in exopolysaccharide biosynthesis